MASFAKQVRGGNGESLTVVGSGISGLMTAWKAAKAGYKVTLFSKSPDPRITLDPQADHQSSTFDSQNDQRYITLFEGHPYLELAGYVDKMYPGIAEDFRREVLQGGILAVPPETFAKRSIQWLEERTKVNGELKAGDQQRIKEIQDLFAAYARENRAAMAAWYGILTQAIKTNPELLKELTLSHKGIVRLYDNHDVFEQAKKSHKEEGVFIKEYTPDELVKVYPAYTEGVKRGFIKGGALEVYGLTFGVQAMGRHLLNELTRMGVDIHFGAEVERIIKSDKGAVEGISVRGMGAPHTSDHYAFHTGAFAGPELFENIPQAKDKLAAVEGYWITIENADRLIREMGDMPNKVHGKKNLAEILTMVDPESAARYRKAFQEFGIPDDKLASIAPIVDFNNMPIRRNGKVSLGVGSGYIFKGLAERGQDGAKVTFTNNQHAEKFVLTVMELWLEALHGRSLLTDGAKIVVHPKGCKRSWTPNDRELDVNLPTVSGGLCMIHDGGNTGSTTKSTFMADYILKKMGEAKNKAQPDQEACLRIRKSLGKSASEVGSSQWARLTKTLDMEVGKAERKLGLPPAFRKPDTEQGMS